MDVDVTKLTRNKALKLLVNCVSVEQCKPFQLHVNKHVRRAAAEKEIRLARVVTSPSVVFPPVTAFEQLAARSKIYQGREEGPSS